MRNARCLRLPGVVALVLAILAQAWSGIGWGLSLDITSQFTVSRSGYLFNRATGTFDSTVKLTNVSGFPVLGRVDVAVAGLPASVTLANKVGVNPDGRPYVTPVAPGAMLDAQAAATFVLKFSNPQNVPFSSTLQVLHPVETPADAPSLISAVATGGSTAYLVGRADGLPGQAITVQARTAAVCVSGVLVNGAPAGGALATTTDAYGYFAVSVPGVNPGAYVTLGLATPRSSAQSLCQASTRDNDAWPKAFVLDGNPAQVTDFIDAPGKARWYRFAIQPGQRIEIALSNPATDYDLAVFKDIGQAFLAQFNPANATTTDLVKLAAQYAPSMFSPSMFSPSVFSPEAYTPSMFSPSMFSPSMFSPSMFSPSMFSPSMFSPSMFSPSMFSPSMFSPSMFSPSMFSPSIVTPDTVAKAFSTAQTTTAIAVSATPGNGSEAAVVNTWNSTGSFYVRVTGRNGAFSTTAPFALRVAKGATTCANATDTVVTPRSAKAASGLMTVIVTDSSKVPLDDLLTVPGGGTLRGRLAEFARRGEVKGVIVDVAGDARVTALKQQATANPACPFAMNLVAEQIKAIVDSYRSNPLRYVVLVGNDDAVPFFRSPDQSNLGQESGFVPPVQSNSPLEASLRRDFVLSQDGYGAKTRLSLSATDFPVPGLAVGRLLETPDEIAGVIAAYTEHGGVVSPRTSLVTGYDFLEDAAVAVRGELQAGTGANAEALITPRGTSPQDPASWTATQLKQALLGSRHDVVFLAGHFSANSALAADFATSLVTTDVAASSVDLTNAIVFSAGCHSGFNIADSQAIPGVTLPLDWTQVFARKRATLIAGTGYQYGDTDFLEYSERLYRNFARHLRAGTGAVAVGEALVRAKLDYLASTPDVRGIHEKALLESTLFGLPMLGVDMPAGRGAVPSNQGTITPVAVASGPAATLGLRTHNLSVAPATTPRSTTLRNVQGGPDVVATWLEGADGVTSRPGEPVLPLVALNVTPTDPAVVLRGVGFRGGSYADSAPLLPFSAAPATEFRGVHVPFVAPVFYPGRFASPNYFGALAGSGGTQLLVTPAQHRAANPAAGTSTRRSFGNLDFRLFYSGNLGQAALSEAPTILAVEDQKAGSDVLFSVQVVGDPAAAVHQVWVTYTADGSTTWTSVDLTQCATPLPAACGTTEDSRLWKGRLANAPANLRYMVQAVSGIGLVAVDDNLGAYHGVGAAAPSATTLELLSPPTVAAIGDGIDVRIKLTYAGVALAAKQVVVSVGGVTRIGSTASDGTLTLRVPVNATPGVYSIAAIFAGDDGFLPSSATTPFTVQRAPSALAAVAPAGVTLTGTVAGKVTVLPQEAVAFTVNGPSGTTTIWATTDQLGRAVLPPPGLPAGTYAVTTATYYGNPTFAPASIAFAPAQQFVVAKTPQVLTFGPLADATLNAPPIELYGSASSGLPVSYLASGSCSVSGNVVTVGSVGTCTVTASQAGDAVYAAVAPVVRSFNVARASQSIGFGPAPTGATVGQPLVMINASSTSPSGAPSATPITFASTTPGVCTVGGGVNATLVSLVGTGTCSIVASQAGDGVFDPGSAALNFAVGAAGAAPTTFTVTNLNDSGAGSLRSAIGQANATPGFNVVDFTPGLTGTITLTSGQIQISGPTLIQGPGSSQLTVSGNLNSRIFSIFITSPACPAVATGPVDGPNDYLVAITGLHLMNARRNADSPGGAIYSEHSLLLDDVFIENSAARNGGGVMFSVQYLGQSLSIFNSRFLNNFVTELVPPAAAVQTLSGGGLFVVERCSNATDTPFTQPVTVTIAGSEFRGNSVRPLTQRDGRGGGIRSWSLADILIADSIIVDNHVDAPNPPVAGQTYYGGGIDGHARSWRIERTEIAENGANDVTAGDVTRGGGFNLINTAVPLQGPANRSVAKIVDSTISGNLSSATFGAMRMNGNISVQLFNTTVSGNLAGPGRTGGIGMARGDTYPATNSIVVRPSLALVSSIVAGNTGADVTAGSSVFGPFALDATNSLVGTFCTPPTCTMSLVGSNNLFGVDPLLGPLQNNGGPTRTHALLPGSPAINTGSNPLGLPTDQRGMLRVFGGTPDIGAYEVQP